MYCQTGKAVELVFRTSLLFPGMPREMYLIHMDFDDISLTMCY